MQTLNQKAHEVMDNPSSQVGSTITVTELDRFGGKTHLLAELGASEMSRCPDSESFTMTRIPCNFPDIDFDTMHPTIAHDMRSFDMGAPTFRNFFDFPTHPVLPELQLRIPDDSFYPESTFHNPYQHHHHHPQHPLPLAPIQNQNLNHINGHVLTQMPYDQSPPHLDSTWQSFVEQLGF